MRRRVVITGMGCVSGLGRGVEANWARLLAGEGAIRAYDPGDGAAMPAAPVEPARCDDALAGRDLRRMGKLDPLSRHVLAATMEAVGEAGLFGDPVLAEETAIVLGCGSGGNATYDVAYERVYARGAAKVHPQTIPAAMVSAPASHVAMLLGARGPALVTSSACASSAHALGEAMHMIRAGRVRAAVAGGGEACLSFGARVAWASLGVVAPDTCRPFSRGRQGLVLGEGAAVCVLEDAEHAAARGARVLGELAGYGLSADAAHITAPDPGGVALAVRAAHRDADLALDAPALISAHGTGTVLNDAVEAGVLRAVYGDALARHTVIATKSAHGHLMGGGAGIEFVLGMRALAHGVAPPLLGYLGPDPACDLPLARAPTAIAAEALVSNSFAFGGLNAVLVGRLRS